jgi:hypothetical protein
MFRTDDVENIETHFISGIHCKSCGFPSNSICSNVPELCFSVLFFYDSH